MTRGLKPFTNPRLLPWTAGVIGCGVLAMLAYAATGLQGSESGGAPAAQAPPAQSPPWDASAQNSGYYGPAQSMWPQDGAAQPGATQPGMPWGQQPVTTAQYQGPSAGQTGQGYPVQNAGGLTQPGASGAANYAVMGQPPGVMPAAGTTPWGEDGDGGYYGSGDFASPPSAAPTTSQPAVIQPGASQLPWGAEEGDGYGSADFNQQTAQTAPPAAAETAAPGSATNSADVAQNAGGESYSPADFVPAQPEITEPAPAAENIAATNPAANGSRLPWAGGGEEYAPSDFAPAVEPTQNIAGATPSEGGNIAAALPPAGQAAPWNGMPGDSYSPSDFAPPVAAPPIPTDPYLPTADLAAGGQLPWQPPVDEQGPQPAQWQNNTIPPEVVQAHEWQPENTYGGPTTLPPNDPRNFIPPPSWSSPGGVYVAGGQVPAPRQAPVLSQPSAPLGLVPQGPNTIPPTDYPRTIARNEVIATPQPNGNFNPYAPNDGLNVPQPYLRVQPGQEPVDAEEGGEGDSATAGASDAPERLGEAPEAPPQQFLRDETILLDPGEYQIDITMQYQTDTTDFALAQVIGNQLFIGEAQRTQRLFVMPLELRVGLTPVVQAFVNVPFGWSNGELAFGGSEINDNVGGIGDVSAGLTRLCIEGQGDFPTVLTSWQFSAPTGQTDIADSLSTPGSALGEGFWSTALGLTFIQSYDPVVLFYGFGYRFRFQNTIEGLDIEPGDQAFYRLGVGVAMNPRVTMTCTFLGSYLAADEVNDITIPGGIREPMQLRLAATILRDPKYNKEASFRSMEPFVAFGLTDSAVDAAIGVSFTR